MESTEPTIALTDLPRRLKADFGKAPSYRQAYNAAVDGRIPAERGENGRWRVPVANLADVAAAFGITATA